MSPSDTESPDAALTALDAFIADAGIDTSSGNWRTSLPMPPKADFDSATRYLWNLETSEGNIGVRLLQDVAPMHASSTIYLTRLGYYDGLGFHRVIQGFMAQGGCPSGTGTGGPGYTYDGEFSKAVRHDRPGLLSMANAGPNTDGSQFFLTFVPTPHLDDKHTIFGEVIDGMDTIKALEAKGSRNGTPASAIAIHKATIEVVPG